MPSQDSCKMHRVVLGAACVLLSASGLQAQAGTLSYDAGLGTLPTQQGWPFFQDGSHPAPTVQGGALVTGPTTTQGRQYWSRDLLIPIDFASGAFVEADLDIQSSNYNPNCGGVSGQRAGYYIGISDNLGRIVWAGLGSSTVFMTSADICPVSPAFPSASFTATGRHLFRIQTTATNASLLIDNVLVLTMPLGAPGVSTPNTTLFSDISICGTHAARLYRLTTTGPIPCDSLDFNNDTLTPDSGDLDDFLAVLAGGPGACSTFPSPGCNDIDFNNDGFSPDSLDLDAFISRLGGGPCL